MIKRFAWIPLAFLASLSMISCGGGGDVAGDVETFSLSPAKVGLPCPPDLEPTYITIIGGTPPFRIRNMWPDALRVDKTEATGKDPVFSITATGQACVNPGTITVLDYHSRSATVEITMKNSSSQSQ